jgi:hypothetical protein
MSESARPRAQQRSQTPQPGKYTPLGQACLLHPEDGRSKIQAEFCFTPGKISIAILAK